MLSADVINFVGLFISSFAVGFILGFLYVHAIKLLDQI